MYFRQCHRYQRCPLGLPIHAVFEGIKLVYKVFLPFSSIDWVIWFYFFHYCELHIVHITQWFWIVHFPNLDRFGAKKVWAEGTFFLVRATMNIKPVLKSSWTKLKHRRCTKRPVELKHINILVLKKSILKKTKKNMETKKLQTLYTSHSLVLPIGHLKQFSLSL